MSKVNKMILKCPRCGKSFETIRYDSINTKLNPELIEIVHNGSLFNIECPHCKVDITLNYPCLYHDMKNLFMVQIGKRENLINFKKNIDRNDPSNPFSLVKDKYTMVGATNYPDWVTVISSLENKLDWRIVQLSFIYIKKYLYEDKAYNLSEIDCIVLDGTKTAEGELILTVYAFKDNKDINIEIPFIRNLYDALCKEHKERLDKLNPFIFEEEDAFNYLNSL